MIAKAMKVKKGTIVQRLDIPHPNKYIITGTTKYTVKYKLISGWANYDIEFESSIPKRNLKELFDENYIAVTTRLFEGEIK